jgi:hypothetical protein
MANETIKKKDKVLYNAMKSIFAEKDEVPPHIDTEWYEYEFEIVKLRASKKNFEFLEKQDVLVKIVRDSGMFDASRFAFMFLKNPSTFYHFKGSMFNIGYGAGTKQVDDPERMYLAFSLDDVHPEKESFLQKRYQYQGLIAMKHFQKLRGGGTFGFG